MCFERRPCRILKESLDVLMPRRYLLRPRPVSQVRTRSRGRAGREGVDEWNNNSKGPRGIKLPRIISLPQVWCERGQALLSRGPVQGTAQILSVNGKNEEKQWFPGGLFALLVGTIAGRWMKGSIFFLQESRRGGPFALTGVIDATGARGAREPEGLLESWLKMIKGTGR